MFRRRALRRRLESAGATPSALDEVALAGLARAAEAGAAGGARLCVRAAPCVRLAALRVWRWADLCEVADLRRLPACVDISCCNPWHWSRMCKPDTPPPPYSRLAMEQQPPPSANSAAAAANTRICGPHPPPSRDVDEKCGDARRTDHERLGLQSESEPSMLPPYLGSLTTDGEERKRWESEWCRLAYWELTRRVGDQYPVRPPSVDVFGDRQERSREPDRGGLWLGGLREPPPGAPPHGGPPPDQVRRTRAKIGLGVTLSLEADGVWLYNRSEEPVFVSSPALDAAAAAARALLVWRVPSGHCLCVFDPQAPQRQEAHRAPLGPVDPRSVRISFAKGWGPKYSRRDVTACPCWLEVMLAPAEPPPRAAARTPASPAS